MQRFRLILHKYTSEIIIGFLLLLFLGIKVYQAGNDINVYLHASQQLFNHLNIYANNPYNN